MTDKLSNMNVTSEDCVLPEMTGKYDLVFFASQRARAIISGSPALVEGFENPKNHSIMVALQEMRERKLTFEQMIDTLSNPYIETKEPERIDVLSREVFNDDDEEEEEEEEAKLDYKSHEEYED
jgi:DNA-directed RNA polymerase subunit K/omega